MEKKIHVLNVNNILNMPIDTAWMGGGCRLLDVVFFFFFNSCCSYMGNLLK